MEKKKEKIYIFPVVLNQSGLDGVLSEYIEWLEQEKVGTGRDDRWEVDARIARAKNYNPDRKDFGHFIAWRFMGADSSHGYVVDHISPPQFRTDN